LRAAQDGSSERRLTQNGAIEVGFSEIDARPVRVGGIGRRDVDTSQIGHLCIRVVSGASLPWPFPLTAPDVNRFLAETPGQSFGVTRPAPRIWTAM
jgi:hypothetical protein